MVNKPDDSAWRFGLIGTATISEMQGGCLDCRSEVANQLVYSSTCPRVKKKTGRLRTVVTNLHFCPNQHRAYYYPSFAIRTDSVQGLRGIQTLVNPHPDDGTGITDHVWTVMGFLHFPVPPWRLEVFESLSCLGVSPPSKRIVTFDGVPTRGYYNTWTGLTCLLRPRDHVQMCVFLHLHLSALLKHINESYAEGGKEK